MILIMTYHHNCGRFSYAYTKKMVESSGCVLFTIYHQHRCIYDIHMYVYSLLTSKMANTISVLNFTGSRTVDMSCTYQYLCIIVWCTLSRFVLSRKPSKISKNYPKTYICYKVSPPTGLASKSIDEPTSNN